MSGKALIAINGHVYDVYPYLSEAIIINNGKSVSEGTPSQTTAFLGSEMTTFLFKNIGQDASVAFKSISNAKPYLKCLDKLYYAGMIANPKSFNSINGFIENAGGCNVINLPLYIIIFFVLIFQLIRAL